MTTATVDDRKRVRIANAKPGQVFSVESEPGGAIRLVPVVPVEPRTVVGKLVRRKGRLVFDLPKGYTLKPEDIAKAVWEERDNR